MSGLTFLLAGDSTVAGYPPEEHPMSGWGAHLEQYLNGLGTVCDAPPLGPELMARQATAQNNQESHVLRR